MDNRGSWMIPGAIIFVGVVIALTVFVTHHHATVVENGNPSAVRPVSDTDHIIGNPAAPVVVIEYADIDNEYSKSFETVMEQIMKAYGPGGNVAWVYRNFPLIGVDTNSEEHAEAAECIAAQGGTQNGSADFFKFVDALETAAPDTNQFDPKGYDTVVGQLGFSVTDFNTCLSTRKEEKRVEADYENALLIGADGSPYTVLLVKGQKPAVISGALPYDTMKQVIDTSIAKVLGTGTPSSASGN